MICKQKINILGQIKDNTIYSFWNQMKNNGVKHTIYQIVMKQQQKLHPSDWNKANTEV